MKRMIIQAHRGVSTSAAENTLESFEKAWDIGTIPEADVRRTRDEVWVAFHDDTLERMVPSAPTELKGRKIRELTWGQIRDLAVGDLCLRIPRLALLFEMMQIDPSRRLYLDFKDNDIITLAALCSEWHVRDRVIFASTHYELVSEWKKLVPESETLHWMGGSEERLQERVQKLEAVGFEGITQFQLHVRVGDLSQPDPFMPSSEFIHRVGEIVKPHGILFQTLPIDCSSGEAYLRLMDLGVESFATDYPEVVLQAVGSTGERPGRSA